MKDNQIYIIFNFCAEVDQAAENKGRYRIIISYDKEGELVLDSANFGGNIEFDTKELMVEHIQRYLADSDYEEVCLIAANDFNIGIESCHSPQEFKDLFITHGSIIHAAQNKEKKSFFGKLF